MVVVKESGSTYSSPASSATYTANPIFTNGTQIGTGNYVVYNGAGSTVTVTGLTAETIYDYYIYAYNSADDCYYLVAFGLASQETAIPPGTNHVLANGTYEIDFYHGDTITTCSGTFTDSNPSTTGNYGNNEDYTITFCSGSGNPMSFDFDNSGHFDALSSGDTLYMYDEDGDLLMKIDATDDPASSEFELSTTSQCVTFRFVSDGSTNDDGWAAIVECVAPPADCNGNEPAADIALQAPYICNFDGYCGSTSSYYHEDLPGDILTSAGVNPCAGYDFGGSIQNNSWLRFVAGATTVSMDFTVSGCAGGIQVAILGVSGNDWTRYSDCSFSDGSNSGTFTLTGTGMTIGEVYYIMADGNAGANCDYTINVDDSDGLITVDAGTDQTVCAGDPVNLSVTGLPGATYVWNSLDGVVNNVAGENQTFNPAVATTYVVEVSGGDICENRTDTVVVGMCVVLPVQLLGFSAECKEAYTQLIWQTATEINNDYFDIEKSIDGLNFSSVGFVDGAGNSSSVINYSLQDFGVNNETTYYRLKQVDFNGEESYSDIVSLNKCEESFYEIKQVYFDGSNSLNIDYNLGISGSALVDLVDVRGRIVQSGSLILFQNMRRVTWPIENDLSGGIYFVRIVSGSNIDTEKVIISKK